MNEVLLEEGEWKDKKVLSSHKFTCGFCGNEVASEKGYYFISVNDEFAHIYICPHCKGPNLFLPESVGGRFPAPRFGKPVPNVPKQMNDLYEEARRCTSRGEFTAGVLACRKILNHIAVGEGAEEGLSFEQHVEYLGEEGYIPPGGREWVDKIRNLGNEADHEIVVREKEDAEKLLAFIEMLLRFIYDFPEKVKNRKPQESAEK